MTKAVTPRTTLDVVKTCLLPEVRFQRDRYEIQSIDGLDFADGWYLEIEWLSLTLHIAGGRYRPGPGA